MSGSIIHSQSAQLPVVIDYPAALALRQMSMVHD